jgi:hypothetical protein
MGSALNRYCARNKQCKLYDPESGQSQKLGRYHNGEICNQYLKADTDADFEASRRRLAKYPRLQHLRAGPQKKRLVALKRELVAQLLGKPGTFRERVGKVHEYWQIVESPARLPPESEDVLLPPNIEQAEDLAGLHAAAANHPLLSPPTAMLPSPDDIDSVRSNLILRWQLDLRHILFAAEEFQKHLEEEPCGPFVSHPLGGTVIPQEHLPWYRFVSACVRYDVPPEEAPAFADYGGLPGQSAEPTLMVRSDRELREREMERWIWEQQEKFILEKIFEKHSLNYYSEMREVMNRFYAEIEEEIPKQIREEFELDMEHNPPRHYRIEFIPGKHTDTDLKNAREEIDERAGVETRRGNKAETPRDNLLPVWCAALQARGWSLYSICESVDRSMRTVEDEVKEGRRLLDPGE